MKHILVCELNDREVITFTASVGCENESALVRLGPRIEPKPSDDSVREFFLVSNEPGEAVCSFFDYLYENACMFGVHKLGFCAYTL